MSIILWIVLGSKAGFVGSKLSKTTGLGVILSILLGIAGALAGGYLYSSLGPSDTYPLIIYSLFIAVGGAVFTLFVYHALSRAS